DDELVEAVAGIERFRLGEVDRSCHAYMAAAAASRTAVLRRGLVTAGEAHMDLRADDRSGAGLEDSTKALCNPGLRGGRGLEKEQRSVDCPDLERLEPDLVRRLADHAPELDTDLVPCGQRLEMRRQLQATPPRSVEGNIAEVRTGEGPSGRIYQRR